MRFKEAERLNSVNEYYFSKKLEEIRVLRSSGLEIINLGIGSPDLSPEENVIEKTCNSIKNPKHHGYASYRSIPELRSAFGEWYKKTYDVNLTSEIEVLPLLGSKEGIMYLSMAFLNPGDTVLIPNPGYPTYTSVANLLGAKIIYYNLTEENNWLPNIAELESYDLKNCKLMWINFPNMPTGQKGSEENFKELVAFARKHNILICNDNPYGLVLNETKPMSIFKVDPDKEFCVEMNSLSKSFNMAGWRVGVMLSNKEIIDAVVKVKSNVDSGMFLPIQHGAIEALKASPEWHKKRNDTYRERREIVWKIFDLLTFKYSKEQVGLFVWAKAPSTITNVEEYLNEILYKANVFLTPGFIFGSNGRNYARASLCSSVADLKKAHQKISEFLK